MIAGHIEQDLTPSIISIKNQLNKGIIGIRKKENKQKFNQIIKGDELYIFARDFGLFAKITFKSKPEFVEVKDKYTDTFKYETKEGYIIWTKSEFPNECYEKYVPVENSEISPEEILLSIFRNNLKEKQRELIKEGLTEIDQNIIHLLKKHYINIPADICKSDPNTLEFLFNSFYINDEADPHIYENLMGNKSPAIIKVFKFLYACDLFKKNPNGNETLEKHLDELYRDHSPISNTFLFKIMANLKVLGILNEKPSANDDNKNSSSYLCHGEGELSMIQFYEKIIRYAHNHEPVLIYGHTGTGKTLVAKQIHYYYKKFIGKEKHCEFKNCNLTTLAKDHLEATLFGYPKGAFTGATNDTAGVFVPSDWNRKNNGKCHQDVVFIDEAAELPINIQNALLKVVEDKKFYRFNEQTSPKSFEGKIVFATNKRLDSLVEQGKFKFDLLHRINVFKLETQPLYGNRKLIEMILERHCGTKVFDPEALEMFHVCEWNGNIRELKNVCINVNALDNIYIFKQDLEGKLPDPLKKNFLKDTENLFNNYNTIESFEEEFITPMAVYFLQKFLIEKKKQFLKTSKSAENRKGRRSGYLSHIIRDPNTSNMNRYLKNLGVDPDPEISDE